MWKIGSFVVATALLLSTLSSYNGFVNSQEHVRQTYSQVQNVLQRQAELIPNLVETVKGYSKHEAGTLTAVTEARSAISAIAKTDPLKIMNDPALQKQVIDAQAQMGKAMVELKSLREAYPDLKANRQFETLMASMEGSINRVSTERRVNQQAVSTYNASIRRVPGALVANIGGFTAFPYYEAPIESQVAPKVQF